MKKKDYLMLQFKHVGICKHPLNEKYMVVNKTFPSIPPYIGSLKACKEAAASAEKNSEMLLKAT